MDRSNPRRLLRIGTLVATAGVMVSLGVAVAPSASAGTLSLAGKTTFVVSMRGNGHGHGMSQYGARGAAVKGLSYRQILAFYYPGTKLITQRSHLIRVRLSDTGTTATISAYQHTTLTGVRGTLPTAGVSRYRLVAGAGTTLILQKLSTAKNAAWTTVRTGLPNGATFHRTNYQSMRLFHPGGASTFYFGYLRVWRKTGGVFVANSVSMDSYVRGVAPREMPASWPTAAVSAQAVAARTYGEYAVQHPQSHYYDLCDTTLCQVYGGHYRYDVAGHRQWSDDAAAAAHTSNQVLTYHGQPVFAQFSASNGGWSVYGGQPYLRGRYDPYDTVRLSGDPYIPYRKTVRVSTLAHAFGLVTVSKIVISKRDGHGAWGGRTLAGWVTGTDRAKHVKSVAFTGAGLQAALGIGTTWVSLGPAH